MQRVLKPGGSLAISDFMVSQYLATVLPRKLNTGFFGVCDVQFTHSKYRKLATKCNLDVTFERTITKNTLPTSRFLSSKIFGKGRFSFFDLFGWITIFFLEFVSRLSFLKYSVFVFEKKMS